MNKCQFCGANTPNAKFCSQSCAGKGGKRLQTHDPIVGTCLCCGKEFSYPYRIRNTNPKFCSHSCVATFHNSRTHTKRTVFDCEQCGNKLKNNQKRFCSRDCFFIHRNKQLLDRFLAGENITDSEYGVPPSIRHFLLEEAGYACTKCGWSKVHPTLGTVPLDINHIDGHSRNNRRNNLEVLCKNCHALTENFGSLNRGNGRSYRYPKPDIA